MAGQFLTLSRTVGMEERQALIEVSRRSGDAGSRMSGSTRDRLAVRAGGRRHVWNSCPTVSVANRTLCSMVRPGASASRALAPNGSRVAPPKRSVLCWPPDPSGRVSNLAFACIHPQSFQSIRQLLRVCIPLGPKRDSFFQSCGCSNAADSASFHPAQGECAMSLLYRSPFGPRHPNARDPNNLSAIPSVLLAPTLRAFPPTFRNRTVLELF